MGKLKLTCQVAGNVIPIIKLLYSNKVRLSMINLLKIYHGQQWKRVQHDRKCCVCWLFPSLWERIEILFELCENLNFLVRVDC